MADELLNHRFVVRFTAQSEFPLLEQTLSPVLKAVGYFHNVHATTVPVGRPVFFAVTQGCPQALNCKTPIAEAITYSSHWTQRNQTGANLEASFLPTRFLQYRKVLCSLLGEKSHQ